MLHIRRSEDRGHADHGWLNAYHTFSFASYRDPEFTRFGMLRVINQDRVQPGKGFQTHGHENMEIVTYVLDGVLEHKDSMGNGSQIRPGEVQLMSAGSGVTHSEFNGSDEQTLELLQMWVFPNQNGTEPRYEQKDFATERRNRLHLVVDPDGRDGALTILQDARLYVSRLHAGASTTLALEPGRIAWLHVARGSVRVNGERLAGGDGAGIRDERQLRFEGLEDADLVLWELADA